MVERCELIEKAKSLALKKKLDTSVIECPMIGVCSGVRCYLFDRDNKDKLVARYIRDMKNGTSH